MRFVVVSQPDEVLQFFVQIVCRVGAEVVIELVCIAGYRGNLTKTKVVGIRLFKRKHHVHKVFSNLCDVSNALLTIAEANHGFGRMNGDGSSGFKRLEHGVVKCKGSGRFVG